MPLDGAYLLLRICRELRHTGEQDERLRRMEIQLLSRYAPDQGFALVEEFINESLSPAYFVAFRNVLAVRLGKTDIVQVDNSSLPRPADLSPRESYLVTLPFEALEMYENAMQFLYDQLRLFFDDEVAHESYVSFLLTYGGKTSFHQRPKTVLGECAVLLESQRGACRWVVIENNNPVPTRGEFAEGSGLALSMIGRAVNDVVEIPGGLSQPDTATIREIQTKYARAFQDCLDLFRERFPEARFIQRLHVGSGDEFDPTPIVASLMQRREYVEKCFEFYKKNLCSLYLLARRLGVCEFDAMTALTQQSGGLVRCCVTTPSEFQRLANMGNPDEIIVMDISAIATLTLLDAWHCLDPKRCYLVSHATKELIDHLVIRARNERSAEGGYANVDEHGRLLIQETTSEQREAQYARLNYIREMIEYHCECRSSQAVAELPREKRNVYEKVAGFHNIEAMSLAKAVKAVVWTDDLFLASIAKSEFGVPVTWTQLGLRWFVESGHLANDEFDLVSAKLASWNYEMTIWNADTIVKSAEHAQWDPQRWPFRQCIDLIDKTSLTKTEKAQMVLVCLKLLRRSSCSEMRQTSVIQMLLDALGDRRVVIWMHQQLDQVFTVDIRSAAFVRMQIEYWLQLHLV
jgi:hypothetical protein